MVTILSLLGFVIYLLLYLIDYKRNVMHCVFEVLTQPNRFIAGHIKISVLRDEGTTVFAESAVWM